MYSAYSAALHSLKRVVVLAFFSTLLASIDVHWACGQAPGSLQSDLALVKNVGPDAVGYDDAIAAVNRLSGQSPEIATAILASMKDASPLAKNWLRIVAADVADNGEFPIETLLAFFADRSQDNDARHAAYQILIAKDPSLKAKLLQGSENDPSLPIRHQAIASVLDEANKLKETDDKVSAKSLYRLIVLEGRNPDQLQAAVKALDSLGEKVELADELGLIRRWWAIGTYDNTDSTQFATVYPPEKVCEEEGRLPASWLATDAQVPAADGSKKPVSTKLVISDDSFGVVSINPTFDNAKDAIAYCYVEFEVPEAIDAVAKLGCITASKVWINGKEVMANEVYHSGSRIDQYTGDCRLVQGTNSVLLKVCQNAQTEPWAQDWQFQFRLTDRFGGAIKPSRIVQPPK